MTCLWFRSVALLSACRLARGRESMAGWLRSPKHAGIAVGKSASLSVRVGSTAAFDGGCLVHANSVGDAYEADGRGIPPQDIREAILLEEGEYELHVSDAIDPKICIAKSIRKELILSMEQAAALISKMPGAVANGTNAEMQRLALLIRNECSYTADVRRRAK